MINNEKSKKLQRLKDKKEVINFASQELIKRKERKEILKLAGKLHWEGDLNGMRGGR